MDDLKKEEQIRSIIACERTTDAEKLNAISQLVEESYLWLKGGTWKSYKCGNNKAMKEALNRYNDGGIPISVFAQTNTKEQIEALCDAIDACNGTIGNEWTGEIYDDKEEAKKYVREYGKDEGSQVA